MKLYLNIYRQYLLQLFIYHQSDTSRHFIQNHITAAFHLYCNQRKHSPHMSMIGLKKKKTTNSYRNLASKPSYPSKLPNPMFVYSTPQKIMPSISGRRSNCTTYPEMWAPTNKNIIRIKVACGTAYCGTIIYARAHSSAIVQ